MRVVAARFPDRGSALLGKDLLQRRLGMDGPSLGIAPLGIPGEAATSATLLAGRFPDDLARHVAVIVREAGGEVVANVDETWTRPRVSPQRHVWPSYFSAGRPHA